jgi:Tat protein secretion system quality control protein TatD with DNase activity
MKESERNIKLAEQHLNLYFTPGIGECGLDYNRNFSSQSEQINAFRNQIELAKNIM